MWLRAAVYYCDHMDEISSLLQYLYEEDDFECIKQTMRILEHTNLKKDLLYIKEHLKTFVLSVEKLDNPGKSLCESLVSIDEIKKDLQSSQHQEWLNKFNEILSANCDLNKLIEIALHNNFIFKPEGRTCDEEKPWTYKYAPVVCRNIERLSYPKSLLENEKMFNLKNFKKEKYEIL